MNVGYRYRIYPNKKQKQFLNKQIGASRFIWNQLLDRRFTIYSKAKEAEEKRKTKIKIKYPGYSVFKHKFTWLNTIDSNALAYEQLHQKRAFENYYENYNPKDPSSGMPKFKTKYKKRSYTTAGSQIKIIDNKYILLPLFKRYNLPPMKIILHRPYSGRIVSGTIYKTPSDKYYISLITETEIEREKLPLTNSVIAIDMGIKQYLTYVKANGETGKIENPRHYKKMEDRINFYNKELSRRKQYSQNWKKTKRKLGITYEKMTNVRRNFLDNLTNEIIKNNDVIVIEDIKVQEIMKKNKEESSCNKERQNKNKAQQDASWYTFRQMLEYKSNWYGRRLIIADEDFKSTEICNKCGYVNNKLKDVKIRKWVCPECGEYHDRDINACYNLLKLRKRLLRK